MSLLSHVQQLSCKYTHLFFKPDKEEQKNETDKSVGPLMATITIQEENDAKSLAPIALT